MTDIDPSFEEFVHRQFPFRPDHPYFDRLQVVVEQYERFKKEGRDAEEVFKDLGADIYSVAYMAVTRSGMNLPPTPANSGTVAKKMSDAWMEGFLFGALLRPEEKD